MFHRYHVTALASINYPAQKSKWIFTFFEKKYAGGEHAGNEGAQAAESGKGGGAGGKRGREAHRRFTAAEYSK